MEEAFWKTSFQPRGLPRWTILAVSITSGLLGIGVFAWLFNSSSRGKSKRQDATSTDPGLMQKGTTFESYQTLSGHVYPSIRTFYHEHPQAKKLPGDLPLLVFMHGLGGSAAQFTPLLTSMVNVAPCLAIDLPGCGRSSFEPHDDTAYTTTAFAELLYAATDRFRKKTVNQKVILFGHSMGCSIAALLASSNSPLSDLCSHYVLGMIAICPRSTTLSRQEMIGIERINYVWSPIFDLVRLLDRRGGIESKSVLRVAGKDADIETRKLQLRFNQQSKSAVFQKVLMGVLLSERETTSKGEESLLGRRVWNGLKVPLFLIAAKGDKLAPPKHVEQITAWLDSTRQHSEFGAPKRTSPVADDGVAPGEQPYFTAAQARHGDDTLPSTAGDVDIAQEQISKRRFQNDAEEEIARRIKTHDIEESNTSTKHSFTLKTTVFPESASHGLLYATKDVRVLAGLIEGFLAKHVDSRLSPGWQLQHMTTSHKWDVKNLDKWQKVEACSEPIVGIFRAMKTMREIDDTHNPKKFVEIFGWKVIPDGVAMVIDISHDMPVYNKEGLEDGGVEYHKFPTVSKLPPTEQDVEQFIGLIDNLRQSPKMKTSQVGGSQPTIAVHCHYGFNRTGLFVVSYLVEREKWKLEDAIQEFASKRPPGIRHDWFIDQLYVRYGVKIQRRSTIIG